jgi:hypothetical protein
MKKTRKFGDGGETEDLVAPESRETILRRVTSRLPKTLDEPYTPEPEEPSRAFAKPDRFSKPDSFKTAFAEARAAGDKNFEWNGTKYSTALAGKSTPSATEKAFSTEGRGKNVVAKPKYQSLQDRNSAYEAKLATSGKGMYGTSKSVKEPRSKEPRSVMQISSSDMKGPYKGMGTDYKPKMRGGESFARGGGIEQRGKTRGRMC